MCHWTVQSSKVLICTHKNVSLITRFLEPTWGPSGAERTQVGPMLASWTLLSGIINVNAWSATDLHKNTMVILVRYWFGETAQQRKTWFSRYYLINVTFRRYIDIYINSRNNTDRYIKYNETRIYFEQISSVWLRACHLFSASKLVLNFP